MDNIETFITALSIIIVLAFLRKFITPVIRERKKGRNEIFIHMRSSFTDKEFLCFRMALLWLFVYFYTEIVFYATKALILLDSLVI